MPRLLVTAPHSFCIPARRRHCDTVALSAVNHIREYTNGHDIKYHVSDRLRNEGDYNRPVTNNEPWRRELRELAQTHKPEFVLEVHSFPGNHPTYIKKWDHADIVIFESEYNIPFINKLIERVHYHSNWAFKIKKGWPWHNVALTDDLAPLYKHTLFEFNETGLDSDRKKLAHAIVDAAADIIKLQNGEKIDMTKQYVRDIVKIICISALVIFVIIMIYFALYAIDAYIYQYLRRDLQNKQSYRAHDNVYVSI